MIKYHKYWMDILVHSPTNLRVGFPSKTSDPKTSERSTTFNSWEVENSEAIPIPPETFPSRWELKKSSQIKVGNIVRRLFPIGKLVITIRKKARERNILAKYYQISTQGALR